MLIILALYLVLIWLLFSKLKLIRFGWISGAVAALGGAFILAVFYGLFNYLTPSGSFIVVSPVTEVAPNVSGQVVEIPIKPNEPVQAGAVLFRIDPAPFQYKVQQLEASLAQAQQQVKQLKASYDQATANVEGLSKQLAFHQQRLADYEKMVSQDVQTEFRLQDTQVQYETVRFQLEAAKAAQQNAKLAMESEIGGVNTTVAQMQAQLDNAKWDLEQTEVRAPADGVVTLVALTIGDRTSPAQAVMSFIATHDIMLIGMFAPNGFETIKPGAAVQLVFDNRPGRVYNAKIRAIPHGVGQGQIAVSGILAKSGAVTGAKTYPALITIPDELQQGQLRLGMPGKAAVFSEKAGVIGTLMSIIMWISSYTAYL
jgi:multidrug resistance efflux pump